MIEWDSSLETGEKRVDSQHRAMVETVGRLMEACSAEKGAGQAEEVLVFLIDYTKRHFSDEESLMKKAKYPGYAEHKKLHSNFKKQELRELKELWQRTGPSKEFLMALNTKLAVWLCTHIKSADKDFVRYYKSR